MQELRQNPQIPNQNVGKKRMRLQFQCDNCKKTMFLKYSDGEREIILFEPVLEWISLHTNHGAVILNKVAN